MAAKVSSAVIRRLPRYYRYVQSLCSQGISRVSSNELAQALGFTASQVRQDFSCFGGFGQQGYGYNTETLRDRLAEILNLQAGCRGVIVGMGSMAQSLFTDGVFSRCGVSIAACFDTDPEKIGRVIGDVTVLDAALLEQFCMEFHPAVAVLTCPGSAAQSTADILMRCGVRGIWNFTSMDIQAEGSCTAVENVHLADSLMTLCCRIPAQQEARESMPLSERLAMRVFAPLGNR